MLDSKLKNIARPKLDANTKASQLATLQTKQQQGKQRQTKNYIVILISFAILTLFFIQTLHYTPPNEQQQADVLKVGTLKKATYLYSTNAERNYQFPSLFITGEMTTDNVAKLKQLEQLLNGLEKVPFTESLTKEEGATNYVLEQTNGDTLYLKSVYRQQGSLLIDVKTNQAIAFSDDTARALEQFWMELYLENKGFPMWKIFLLIGISIVAFIILPKHNWKQEKMDLRLLFLTFIILISFIYGLKQFTAWYGVGNIAVFLLMMTCTFILVSALERKFKRTQLTWKKLFLQIAFICLFLFIVLV